MVSAKTATKKTATKKTVKKKTVKKKPGAAARKRPAPAPQPKSVRVAPKAKPATSVAPLAEGQDAQGRYMDVAIGALTQRFRYIAATTFTMGSPATESGRWDDEGPQHEVRLSQGYWMADTEVTQALYEAVMLTNPSRFKGAERPVETVSWDDCKLFITKLNVLVPGLDARLPSEAEWENACRAGTTGATWIGELEGDGIRAPKLDAIAWYYGNSPNGTQPVKQNGSNPLGLYDMLGNVYEWCEDRWGYYEAAAVVDPRGPAAGSYRVIRGGCWSCYSGGVRAADRDGYAPDYRDGYLGLRLARGHQV